MDSAYRGNNKRTWVFTNKEKRIKVNAKKNLESNVQQLVIGLTPLAYGCDTVFCVHHNYGAVGRLIQFCISHIF